MIYKVKSSVAKTTSTGKPMKALELIDPSNNEHKVNIFSDFPDYANINEGYEINGELKQNDKGYTNLYSNNVPEKKPSSSAYKQKVIEETMQKKEQSISKFQDSKELSIKVASTMNKAVELAVAEYSMNKSNFDKLDELVLKWRDWMWKNWDVSDTQYPPF